MRVHVAFVAGSLSACALATGLSAYDVVDPVDASAPFEASSDAVVDDAGPPVHDAGVDACPLPVVRPSEVTAVRVDRAAIVIDGVGDEWPCTMRVAVDRTTAAGGFASAGNATSAELAVAWNEDGLYWLVRAKTAQPPATFSSGEDIYRNDAIEVFAGAPPRGAKYTERDVQVVMDYLNRVRAFRDGKIFDAGGGVVSRTTSGPDGFIVEAFLASSLIAQSRLAPGLYGMNLQVDQHQLDGGQAAYWLYASADASTGCVAPHCNPLSWGSLRLQP